MHYLMSDIHGDCWRFNQMLRKIQFSGSDILYVIGDILDGGNENLRLLNQIRRDPRMRMIKGNHELTGQRPMESMGRRDDKKRNQHDFRRGKNRFASIFERASSDISGDVGRKALHFDTFRLSCRLSDL